MDAPTFKKQCILEGFFDGDWTHPSYLPTFQCPFLPWHLTLKKKIVLSEKMVSKLNMRSAGRRQEEPRPTPELSKIVFCLISIWQSPVISHHLRKPGGSPGDVVPTHVPLAVKHPISVVSISYQNLRISKRTRLNDLGSLTLGILFAFLKEYVKSLKAVFIFPNLNFKKNQYLTAVPRYFHE